MKRLSIRTTDLVAIAIFGGLVLVHHPRPAVAATLIYLTVTMTTRRGLALVVAGAVALGLCAVSEYSTQAASHIKAHARTSR